MLLNNVQVLQGNTPVSIAIKDDAIVAIEDTKSRGAGIWFENAMAIPGLINSHDHLDFNCFSPLGNAKYKNYTDWGKDIHITYKDEIKDVLRIPKNMRAAWGMYKNLIAGVTTVINHGSYLPIENPLISICQRTQNLHSVAFEKNWKWRLNNPLHRNKTCVIHIGEGSDEQSTAETDELLKYNLLRRKIVGVHGVAMTNEQAENFFGLVWCPVANETLLGRHANVKKLKHKAAVVLGTDSTLTGSWNIWDHLVRARALQQADDEELFRMVTSLPANLWSVNTGEIKPGKDADIVVVRTRTGNSWEDFYSIAPADILLVISKGNIRLVDEELLPQIPVDYFSKFSIDQRTKYVEGDLPALLKSIRTYFPGVEFPVSG